MRKKRTMHLQWMHRDHLYTDFKEKKGRGKEEKKEGRQKGRKRKKGHKQTQR